VSDNIKLVSYPEMKPIGIAKMPDDRLPNDRLDLISFIRGNGFTSGRHTYGYLQPMIRRQLLIEKSVRYPEGLAFCEDYHFLFDCLLAGADWRTIPGALYHYSIRPGSLSRRPNLESITAALQHGQAQLINTQVDPGLRVLMEQRLADLALFLAYLAFRERLRKFELGAALRQLVSRPGLIRVGINGLRYRLSRLGASAIAIVASTRQLRDNA
jgi:succinoglycan biosynthesis protein ExoO